MSQINGSKVNGNGSSATYALDPEGVGRDFDAAVNANPANALVDFACYAITYLSQELFQEKFGKMSASGISRESFSNTAGWA